MHRMREQQDIYSKIGIALLIVLAFIYFPPKLVAGAVLIFAGLFCLAWMLLILPDEVATDYDNQFEPPPWVDRWEEYRTTSDNLEEQEKKPETKKPDNPGQPHLVAGGRLVDEVAGTIEWDVNRKLK